MRARQKTFSTGSYRHQFDDDVCLQAVAAGVGEWARPVQVVQ